MLVELARWGAQHGDTKIDAEALREAIESRRPVVLGQGGVPGEGHFAITVDGVTVGLLVADGDFQVTEEPPRRPVATIVASVARLAGVALGVVPVEEALAAGDLAVKGDTEAAMAVLRAFLTPLPAALRSVPA